MKEIERKFLLSLPLEKVLDLYSVDRRVTSHVEQRYLSDCGKWTTRVRKITTNGVARYFLTLKSKINSVSCHELETEIRREFYEKVSLLCGPVLRKFRHKLYIGNHIWEIDHFLNTELNDLVVVEVELKSEDEVFHKPSWLGEEVTHDRQYKNAKLAKKLLAV